MALCSQQGTQYSQYMLDKYRIIPAYAGMDYSMTANASLRTQYNELSGNPSSQWINVHLPYYRLNGAIGIQISNESLGVFQKTSVLGSYSYIIDTEGFLFGGALQLGFDFQSIDGASLITPEGNYEGGVIQHNDPNLSNMSVAGFGLNSGLSFYLRSRFAEIGAAYSFGLPTNREIGGIPWQEKGTFNLFLQSSINYGDLWRFVPSILVRTDFLEYQSDFHIIAKYNGNVFGGIGLRGYNSNSFDALVVTAGMRLNQNYTLSYSYDAGLSDLRNFNEGSHEIMLSYNLNKLIGVGSDPKIIYNPRHL